MPDFTFTPVDHDPYVPPRAPNYRLVPVNGNPFAKGFADGGDVADDNSPLSQPYVKPGANDFNTDLGIREPAFRKWVQENNIPFNPDEKAPDYDMRGFWNALKQNDPRAQSAIDPNDQRIHYPDFWKTPYHETFSDQSQWAGPVAPQWTDDDKLVSPSARILFDDRAANQPSGALKFQHGGRVNAANIDRNPSEGQIRAGNYAKDHVRIHGMDFTIENAKGSYRTGTGPDGKEWRVKMPCHYGYIRRIRKEANS